MAAELYSYVKIPFLHEAVKSDSHHLKKKIRNLKSSESETHFSPRKKVRVTVRKMRKMKREMGEAGRERGRNLDPVMRSSLKPVLSLTGSDGYMPSLNSFIPLTSVVAGYLCICTYMCIIKETDRGRDFVFPVSDADRPFKKKINK